MKAFVFLLALLLAPLATRAAVCSSYPYTLTNGQTADANQVMANFNAVLSCVNTNVATAGSNSNITALLGLTSPLSVAQGGTGQATSPVLSFNSRVGAVNLLSADVTAALGFTPLSSFNTRTGAVTLLSGDVTTALGFTPLAPANNLSELASAATALNNLLPSQSGASGKVLSSSGTVGQWSTLASLFGAQSINTNGYITFPGGLIAEWQSITVAGQSGSNFSPPLTFPTAFFQVMCTATIYQGATGGRDAFYPTSTSNFYAYNEAASSQTFVCLELGH